MEHLLTEEDLSQVVKSWTKAMQYSKKRLARVNQLDDAELEAATQDGRVMLETMCLFVHAELRSGFNRLPAEFWRILHAEYGILVYPSALMENIAPNGLRIDQTFTDAYQGHIVMFGRCKECAHPPVCPFEHIQEPPPLYRKEPNENETLLYQSFG